MKKQKLDEYIQLCYKLCLNVEFCVRFLTWFLLSGRGSSLAREETTNMPPICICVLNIDNNVY